MTKYYKVPGARFPYWVVTIVRDWPKPGDQTQCAVNRESATDMGTLYGPEFETHFPNAIEVTREEYETY